MSREPDPTAAGSDHDNVDELMVRYWDGTLSDDELAALNAALAAHPELRAAFQDLCLQVLSISECSAAAQAAHLDQASPQLRSRRRFLWGTAAAAAGVLVAGGAALFPWRRLRRGASRVIAHLGTASGIVRIGSSAVDPTVSHALAVGETVATQGMDSSAEINFLDGTRLILSGTTSIVLPEGDGRTLRLHQGALAADVPARPPDQPLCIVTPEIEVQTDDAKLALTGSASQTVVGVFEPARAARPGIVNLRRLSDSRLVRIRPGEWAQADRQGSLRPSALSRVPDTLYSPTGPERPRSWRAGERVVDRLPPGAEEAFRTVPGKGPLGTHHAVKTQNAWTRGLFQIHDDSWFHLRFRVDRPGFFQVLIAARSPDPTRHVSVVLENNNLWHNCRPGQWHTIQAPFADFSPTRPNFLIEKPLIAFIVLCDSQTVDRGLTVERFWITRRKP